MSYRSLKRVLGETSLERKCRLLFGFCLALLIAGAFWGVDRVAEDLVMTNTRGKGRDLVDLIMLKTHFKAWETFQEHDELVKDVLAEFEKHQVYKRHEILGLKGEPKPTWLRVKTTQDPEEIAIIEGLKKIQKQQLDRLATAAVVPGTVDGDPSTTEVRPRIQPPTPPLDGNAITGAM
ncbi:MAG: hypothetical protein GY917_17340, partial [Planctomycetaceae bacterium]|nr:hypothetical protein [Planctomycetaceae bacterium]